MQYTVIALYQDTGQRWADVVEAKDPVEAEQLAQKECCRENEYEDLDGKPLVVAGVIEGAHTCVDEIDPALECGQGTAYVGQPVPKSIELERDH